VATRRSGVPSDAFVLPHLSDVVIFELTELVRAFLASHNEPAAAPDLHTQMLERRAVQDARQHW
jgi:hypothetical protein